MVIYVVYNWSLCTFGYILSSSAINHVRRPQDIIIGLKSATINDKQNIQTF